MILLRNIAFYTAFYLLSTAIVVIGAIIMIVSEKNLNRLVFAWSNFHRWCVTHLLGIEVRIEGEIGDGPILYAIRHESFFEAIDAPTLFQHPAVFAKQELFRIPIWGWMAKRYGLVSVEREQGAKALRKMITAAKERSGEGRELVIFPEGTRIAHGQPGRLKSGFAGLYKLIGLPVVPVAVNSGRLYHRLLKRPGIITYRFGERIPPGLPRPDVEGQVSHAMNALNG